MEICRKYEQKSSFLLWQICQFNHYGWLILLKFYWFLNSKSQNLLLARFLIRPILDPKFPLMDDDDNDNVDDEYDDSDDDNENDDEYNENDDFDHLKK